MATSNLAEIILQHYRNFAGKEIWVRVVGQPREFKKNCGMLSMGSGSPTYSNVELTLSCGQFNQFPSFAVLGTKVTKVDLYSSQARLVRSSTVIAIYIEGETAYLVENTDGSSLSWSWETRYKNTFWKIDSATMLK